MADIVSKLILQVGIFFLLMLPGIIMKKCRLSTDGFGKGVSSLVLYIAQPALIFLAYLRPYDKDIFINCLWVLLLSVLAHTIFVLAALLLFRRAEDSKRRMLRMATIFSNAAFLGIPLIDAILGAEATLYASIYNITFNLVLWSLGVFLCTAGKDMTGDGIPDDASITRRLMLRSLLKALLHPVTLAAALGLLFFFFPIEGSLPEILYDTLSMLKSLVAPLSMIVIGLRLADMKWKGTLRDGHMYLFLCLRHLILPLAVFGAMRALALLGMPLNEDVFLVILIMASAPAASSSTMFAERFDGNAPYASRLVTISTLLSILTMPLIVALSLL